MRERAPGRTPEDVTNRTAPRRAALAAAAVLTLAASSSTIPSATRPAEAAPIAAVLPPAAVTPRLAGPFALTIAGDATTRERQAAPASRHSVDRSAHAVHHTRTVRRHARTERISVRAVHRVRPVAHHTVRHTAPRPRTTTHRVVYRGGGGSSAMLRYAYQQLGDRYVFGGERPGAWDCSGLTKASARRAGVSLPHSAAGQSRAGRAVSRGAARPGDLVVWGGSHVGIYVGGGRVLHAPKTGDHVKIAPIWGSPHFRRIS